MHTRRRILSRITPLIHQSIGRKSHISLLFVKLAFLHRRLIFKERVLVLKHKVRSALILTLKGLIVHLWANLIRITLLHVLQQRLILMSTKWWWLQGSWGMIVWALSRRTVILSYSFWLIVWGFIAWELQRNSLWSVRCHIISALLVSVRRGCLPEGGRPSLPAPVSSRENNSTWWDMQVVLFDLVQFESLNQISCLGRVKYFVFRVGYELFDFVFHFWVLPI